MLEFILIIAILFSPSIAQNSFAATPKPGNTCSIAGQLFKTQNGNLTCKKSGKKLFWVPSGGNQSQGSNSISIGSESAYDNQGQYNISIGYQAGQTYQGTNSTSGSCSIAIGNQAGQSTQGINSIALGYQAGYTGQGMQSIAIGSFAGYSGQASQSIAIGNSAGSYIQNIKKFIYT